MRLYLSSFRLGPHPDHLRRLIGDGRRTALVPNALDAAPADARSAGLARDLTELRAAGLEVTTLDLRHPGATAQLAEFDLVWVRGGNVFALRRALADSGADTVLLTLLERDALVYGGYSAGGCVLAPDLTELGRVDDVTVVAEPIMTGLGVLDRPFVPHVDSPGHPETADCDAVSGALAAAGRPHWALRDGEVLLVDSDRIELLPG